MTRHHQWPRRLGEAFAIARGKSFAWGSFDCGLFAADCILAMTGEDLAAQLRGKYSSEVEVAFLIEDDLGAFAAGFGLPEISRTHARRGDLVLIRNGDAAHALGIVGLDPRYALCAGSRGLVKFPIARWIRTWRVG